MAGTRFNPPPRWRLPQNWTSPPHWEHCYAELVSATHPIDDSTAFKQPRESMEDSTDRPAAHRWCS
jgi:hypothetical protein